RSARAACLGRGLLLCSQVLLRHQEEVLVDLALVDRHALFDAHPDHLLPVETELLRQFFGREVIRHLVDSFSPGTKTPAARNALAGLHRTLACRVRGHHSARPAEASITQRICLSGDGEQTPIGGIRRTRARMAWNTASLCGWRGRAAARPRARSRGDDRE